MDIKFLAFDIDDTLLPSHHRTDEFFKFWNRIEFESKPLLCYNTGRLKEDTLRLISKRLVPRPDYLICGVGTLIYDVEKQQLIKKFSQILEEGWNLEKISELISSSDFDIKKQPAHFQNQYKSSWFFDDATDEEINKIRKLMRQNGLDVNVVYSSSRHLDVLPKYANKGNSLEWLLEHLDIRHEETVVAGNSGNDLAMYQLDDIKGIVVGNAQPELLEDTKNLNVYYSNKLYHDAILEGLIHFGIRLKLSDSPEPREGINLEMLNLMEGYEITGITKKQQKLITDAYEQAVETIMKNITPLGFSACSLDDNVAVGTDANYRSVWARDGSITITGTIPLMGNDKIFECQRKTLETLFENTNDNGQVPSNISIDTLSPDYSGIDGVCSIDSGLWTVIAFHDFVKASGDIDFLRKHMKTVSNIMVWLNAHDGNNDSLLEIPEAGDWMNLKGRSYNVLYDEVLWYRANICVGRLYELLGKQKLATKHITWSQVIKNSILVHFWPASQMSRMTSQPYHTGYSSNNGMYLFAQTTPFGFGWRCDVYANVLAHLFNIVDESKAIDIFRFIWGSGGNKPFPVKNIYPAVVTSDPDQRPYYSGNLLNLPNHYHNGGIWPFIGGAWVRSISKLGLREVALKELYRLAGLNQRGIFNKWEFNEWFHGETGRPMGKAFQAWSASEYIRACHSLRIVS